MREYCTPGSVRGAPSNRRPYLDRLDKPIGCSNIGFGLLAHLIEVKTGRPYDELLEEKICGPLRLRDTTFVLNEEQRKRLAIGHVGGRPRFMRRGHPMEPWAPRRST